MFVDLNSELPLGHQWSSEVRGAQSHSRHALSTFCAPAAVLCTEDTEMSFDYENVFVSPVLHSVLPGWY